MKLVRIACKVFGVLLGIAIICPSNVFASLTKEQAEEVALFATTFIEKGNERRDENGYPLLVYALSNNWNTCIEIRRSGYNGELYYIKKNNYHMKNSKYLELGYKWCMDCGDFISYVYKTTLGLDMYLEETEDPWHIRDMYADANKYENSEHFEFIYKNVPISSINESKLEPGDIVVRLGSRENHGLIYVGEGMKTAHASRNAIKYAKNPPILGFEVVQLNKFYKPSTIVSIIRVKDGIVETNKKVNSTITWPDTGEEEDILFGKREVSEGISEVVEKYSELQAYTFSIDQSLNEQPLKSNELKNIFEIDYFERYIMEIKNLNMNPNYYEEQICDWVIYEFKKILMQICNLKNVSI